VEGLYGVREEDEAGQRIDTLDDSYSLRLS